MQYYVYIPGLPGRRNEIHYGTFWHLEIPAGALGGS
jgi:hypothetical protein